MIKFKKLWVDQIDEKERLSLKLFGVELVGIGIVFLSKGFALTWLAHTGLVIALLALAGILFLRLVRT